MKSVDAVIITALAEELHAVLDAFPQFKRVDHADSERIYFEGQSHNGCDLAMTSMTSMGGLDAAIATIDMLSHYSPARVILTGIAGALADDVALGDVVVSEQVVDYELAKVRDHETERRWSVYRNDPVFLHRAKQYANENWRNIPDSLLPASALPGFRPKVHFGVVLSGNKVIANREAGQHLLSFWRKALAVEMEGAGVGAALYHHDASIPFTVIKGISDRADANKNDNWRSFAAAAAASYTINLLVDEFGKADMPAPVTVADAIVVPGTSINRYALRVLVASSYSMAELKTLCFDIDVDWDELPGETKTEKIISLFLHCQRKGKLQQLLDAIDRDTNGGITKFALPNVFGPKDRWLSRKRNSGSPPAPSINLPEDFIATDADQLAGINLSSEARTMVIEVSKSSDGTLLYLQHRPDIIFQVSDKNLCPDQSPRTVAKWKRALDDLVEQEILQAEGYEGKVFKITDKGFTVADALQLVSSSSTETPKPDFFRAEDKMERPSQKQSVEIGSSKESTIYQAGRDINLISNPTEVGRIESVHLEVRLTCTLKENVEPPPSEVSFVPVGDSHAYFEGTPGRIRMSFVSPVRFRLLDGSRVIVINQFSLDSGSYLHHRPVNALANFESLSVPIVTVVYGNTLSSFTLLEVSLEVNGKAVWYGAWNYNVQFQTRPRFSLPLDQLRERLSA